MANIKITDLTAYTNPASTDVLPIVDVGADVTKKVSIADLLENAGSGTEALPGIAFDGDPNTGISRPGEDQLAISTNGNERLRITSDGKVGLGTSSPAELLHLSGGSGANTDINSVNNLINISDLNSRYNGTTTAIGNFSSGIKFDMYQANGNRRFGSFIYQVVNSNNFTGGPVQIRSSLVFGTRGDEAGPSGSPVERLRIDYAGNVGIADAGDITVGTTTGTKIGTATSQKIGFYNATPVVQPTTGVAEAAFVENSGGTAVNVDSTFGGYTIQQVVEALQTLGLLA